MCYLSSVLFLMELKMTLSHLSCVFILHDHYKSKGDSALILCWMQEQVWVALFPLYYLCSEGHLISSF